MTPSSNSNKRSTPAPVPAPGRIARVINWFGGFIRKSKVEAASPKTKSRRFGRRKSLGDFPHHTDTENPSSSSSSDSQQESASDSHSHSDSDSDKLSTDKRRTISIDREVPDESAPLPDPTHHRHIYQPPTQSQSGTKHQTNTQHTNSRTKSRNKNKDQKPNKVKSRERKMTYKKVASIINEVYNNEQTISSTALDMLSVYLKGQKILYVEAKTICEQRMNFLMLPAIMISAVSAVLSLTETSGIIVASMAALNSCILSLISYLKLDARVEAHKTAAYKFDKLQALCEFNSGKVLFFDTKKEDVAGVLVKIEAQVNEIKETNQFVLPEIIRYRYPVLYSTNVFTLVKKLVNREIVLMNRLKNCINAIVIFRDRCKLSNAPALSPATLYDDTEIQIKIDRLEKEQNTALERLIEFRNQYLEIDKEFRKEIKSQSMIRPWYRRLFDCLKN